MLKEIQKDSVALLVPCGGPVEPRVFQHTLNMVSSAQNQGVTVRQVGITDRTLIHTARNILAKGFLETECEWALWMDSDMKLEARTIPTMLNWAKKLDAKLLTGIYYKRLGNHHPVLWKKRVKSEDGSFRRTIADKYSHITVFPQGYSMTPFQVDVAGFGCVFMHRSVLETLNPLRNKDHKYFKFEFFKNENGEDIEASEDFYFFVHAKDAGFKLWAIPELKCLHLGQMEEIGQEHMKLDMSQMTKLDMTDSIKEKV